MDELKIKLLKLLGIEKELDKEIYIFVDTEKYIAIYLPGMIYIFEYQCNGKIYTGSKNYFDGLSEDINKVTKYATSCIDLEITAIQEQVKILESLKSSSTLKKVRAVCKELINFKEYINE